MLYNDKIISIYLKKIFLHPRKKIYYNILLKEIELVIIIKYISFVPFSAIML